MNGPYRPSSGRAAWGITEDEMAAARRDLAAAGTIAESGTGYGWGPEADRTSRLIVEMAAGDGWEVRAVINGRAMLRSADGRRFLTLVVHFAPLRVAGGFTHETADLTRMLTPAEVLDFLAGEQ